jgi:synaptojanin
MLVRREWLQSASLWTNHRELWAENGDALSRIYAGTGALNTSFTRSGKRTLAGESVVVPVLGHVSYTASG